MSRWARVGQIAAALLFVAVFGPLVVLCVVLGWQAVADVLGHC